MPIFNRRQAGFIVFEDGGTDGSGTDAGDKIIFDGGNNGDTAEHFLKYQDDVSDEAKPKFLTEAADGSGDYSKENVFATDSGWVMRPGSPATGNDNPDAQPEVLVCSRGLKSFGLGGPTARQITIGNASSKTTFFPDGDTFSGAASSSENDIVVYTYFNEPVGVQGTPQLDLAQATALGSSFSTLNYKSSLSNLDAGIVAFGLDASVDTRTSAVTNNTLGVNSDDSIFFAFSKAISIKSSSFSETLPTAVNTSIGRIGRPIMTSRASSNRSSSSSFDAIMKLNSTGQAEP